MRRSPVLAQPLTRILGVALAVALALGLCSPIAANAADLPSPSSGGPGELLRYAGDGNSATGSALSNSASCDVNGDDYDDGVVGAWFWDKGATNNIGAAYVLLGGKNVRGAALADPAQANAVRIDGPATANSFVGFSVACLGDVNGDDLDDIAISHYTAQKTYIVFGKASFTGVTLDSLGDRGFVVTGGPTSGNVGYSFASVGDLNADGKDDFAVAEVAASTLGRNRNGRIWVVAGRDDISDVDLTAPASGQLLLTVDGAISEERLGVVAAAGDVNGDDVDDFVLGSYTSTPWGASVAVPGAAYVVFGGGTSSTIDLAALGTQGFTIRGPQRQRDRLGISVSAAGDVDGDGLQDLLLGADGVNNATTGARNGGAAVVFGSASNATVYTDPVAAHGQSVFTCPDAETPGSCDTPTRRGYWINGAANQDSTGYSVSSLGDVDKDGTPDFALGAYGFDPVDPANTAATLSGAGAAWVVYGDKDANVQQLAGLSAEDGYRIDGLRAGDRLGRQVGRLGDFDGNGTSDFFAGADFAPRPLGAPVAQSGEVVVALLGKLQSTAALTGPATVTPGQDATFTATVAKPAGDPTPLATGTVTFSLGGTPLAGCVDLPVTAGQATCTTNSDDEVSGPVTAAYSGTAAIESSTSAPQAFSVAKLATLTGLTVSDADPDPGQLVQLRAAVSRDTGDSVDDGTVAFVSDGNLVAGCKAVPVDQGDAICTTSWDSRGDRTVRADFSGTQSLKTSSSGLVTVSVGSLATIRPGTVPTMTYGIKPAPLKGSVEAAGAVPTGTVTVRRGTTVLGSATLASGDFSVPLAVRSLAPGSHTLVYSYEGDAKHRPSTRNVAVSVRKATSTVSVTRSRSTAKVRKDRVVVTATVRTTGVTPMGQVRVVVTGLSDRVVNLTNGVGRVTLPVFTTRGTKNIRVTYLGSTTVLTGKSSTSTVKVS